MPYNKILEKKAVSTIVKNGKTIILSVATKTEKWNRPDFIPDTMKDSWTQAVSDFTGTLPDGTKEICAREGNHPSPNDRRDHFTGVCFDETGNGKSTHFPVKK